jgi:hypothetical protein
MLQSARHEPDIATRSQGYIIDQPNANTPSTLALVGCGQTAPFVAEIQVITVLSLAVPNALVPLLCCVLMAYEVESIFHAIETPTDNLPTATPAAPTAFAGIIALPASARTESEEAD